MRYNSVATRFQKGRPAPLTAFRKGNIPWNKGKAGFQAGDNHPNWKGGKVEKNCLTCGGKMEIAQWQIREGRGRFCSRECFIQYQKTLTGIKSSGWRGGRMDKQMVCAYCGKEFHSRLREKRESGNLRSNYYCSRSCWYRSDECAEIARQGAIRRNLELGKFKGPTGIERKVYDELERRGFLFETQKIIEDRFIVDVYIPKLNLIIECDGDYWHSLPKSVKKDKAENAYLAKCGFKLLRWPEHKINNGVESLVDSVKGVEV